MPGLGRRHPARMTLDVVMEDFWTRPAGVYSKPVWLRPDVLQLVFDDDNSPSKTYSGPTVPGGHTAFTRTATVYSTTLIGAGDLTVESDDPITEVLRNQVAAFTQRVGNCYLVEANILGFAGVLSGLKEEQAVLSNALKWALADYGVRFGKQPEQIVLHLDVNGTLALGDVAGNKNFGKMVNSLAAEVLKRVEEKVVSVPDALRDVILRANEEKEEGVLRQQFTANYSSQDFIRCVVMALGALAPAAIQDLDDQLSGTAGAAGDFNEKFRSATTAKAFDEARAAESLEAPALTLAIRTNGVEHRQGSVYVQRLVHGVLGVELSDERDTVRRYLVTHEDRARGLFFHPVLLEKLHKSGGSYTFEDYAKELQELYGKAPGGAAAWEAVSAGTLKKSDKKYKVYLGLCKGEDDKPAGHSADPPKLDVAFLQETWLMPSAKFNDYRLKGRKPGTRGPWWAGFAEPGMPAAQPADEDKPARSRQPYGMPISSEPVPGAPAASPVFHGAASADAPAACERVRRLSWSPDKQVQPAALPAEGGACADAAAAAGSVAVGGGGASTSGSTGGNSTGANGGALPSAAPPAPAPQQQTLPPSPPTGAPLRPPASPDKPPSDARKASLYQRLKSSQVATWAGGGLARLRAMVIGSRPPGPRQRGPVTV
mmetsp:Transcript_65590/g.179901  ORF Transcript_65590/g.179901 Transcript_65590/m.179901 type:complete len:656 (+) Transcript_65590:132-2099(+)